MFRFVARQLREELVTAKIDLVVAQIRERQLNRIIAADTTADTDTDTAAAAAVILDSASQPPMQTEQVRNVSADSCRMPACSTNVSFVP